MTHITATKKGNRMSLTATGHATGNDYCCVSISAVLNALTGWIENAEADESTQINVIRKEVAPGKVRLICEGDDIITTAFEMAIIGLKQLEKTCPGYCECKYFQHI